jgi:predicted lipid-binding transport protein (Tim44 family)
MLQRMLSILLVALVAFGLMMQDAQAKRFGGGRSFGYSRAASSYSKSSFSRNHSNLSHGLGQKTSSMGRWFGPLAGLLTGGLLASLFMSHGIGSGILSWLLVGGLLFVLITLLRAKKQTSPYSHAYHRENQSFARDAMAQFMQNNQQNTSTLSSHPIGFDEASFLRDAKVQFTRLQTAYDQKNLDDIRTFTTPEVFAEIQMQLHERGNEENKTAVISIDAALLDVEDQAQAVSGVEMQAMLASVRFTGLIQENRHEPATQINEIWHFRKEVADQHWVVAGVQQH